MSDLQKAIKKITQFRDARNWKQFHNGKDMALSLALEAAEVLEHFQWRNGKELENYIKTHRNELAEELADVFYWVLLISNDNHIDILKALNKKMKKNTKHYPVKKAKGVVTKYTKL